MNELQMLFLFLSLLLMPFCLYFFIKDLTYVPDYKEYTYPPHIAGTKTYDEKFWYEMKEEKVTIDNE
jgi:hypothetical protein